MNQYQEGYKLRDLKAFLKQVVGDKIAKRMDCEMGSVQLMLNPKFQGQGYDLLYQRYVAEFLFDKFPFKEYSPAVLFSNVGAWLMDNDKEREQFRELGDPEIEVVIEDESNAEVLISIEFDEAIKVTEDPNGQIYWKGKRWKIEEYDVYVAKKVQVNTRA